MNANIFYGYGLGLYGSVERIWQMAFVAALIIAQLLWSKWWLERYRFGPAEGAPNGRRMWDDAGRAVPDSTGPTRFGDVTSAPRASNI